MKKSAYSFTILIEASPFDYLISQSAYNFTKAALVQHKVDSIFFNQQGIYHCLSACHADTTSNLFPDWIKLAKNNSVDLCISIEDVRSRGLEKLFQSNQFKIKEIFRMASIGQLFEAMLMCDRFIQFKGIK
ncbi:MAG: DsrE family protein [Pseudomonadota bacterium]